jgi:hypothetical protein
MTSTASFTDLLRSAVTEPGTISTAYRQFHTYSLGNQLLAWSHIPPGPMATYPKWRELGRHVCKGAKALTLCMPVTVKRKGDADGATDDSTDETSVFTRFIYRPRWFVLTQTEGAELPETPIPSWVAAVALVALEVTEIPFDLTDGNVLGYARGQSLAISAGNPIPERSAQRILKAADQILKAGATDATQATEAQQ